MTRLYTVADLIAATGGKAQSVQADSVGSISIDSRDILPGALFVAIKGDNFDGHDFVGAAIENGAALALVSEAQADRFGDLPLLIVPDALEGLCDIARFARARCAGKIIAVTGSVGKTSTKELVRQIGEGAGRTHASIKSFNNHWGVPLMLARMPADTQFGVFEIGMSAAEEIRPLSKMVRPDIAMITNIAPAHLENFKSVAGIAAAKAEIFDGLEPGGTAVINVDHAYGEILLAAARQVDAGAIVTYGFGADADVQILPTDDGNSAAAFTFEGAQVDLRLATKGRHRLANATGAYLAARAAGIDGPEALDVLARARAPEGRGAVQKLGAAHNPLILVDESYNANPASMVASLDVFGQLLVTGAKILVLADMRELGEQSLQLHAQLKDAVVAAGASRVFLVGPHMVALAAALEGNVPVEHRQTADEIKQTLINSLDYGDAVMIKGSNSMRLNRLVFEISTQFGSASGDA